MDTIDYRNQAFELYDTDMEKAVKYFTRAANHKDIPSAVALAAYYYEHITNPLITLPSRIPDENNVYHQFPILCERREELQEYLKDNGIQTLIHYPIPPHKQECYKEWNDKSLPITEQIANEELSLPIGPTITIVAVSEIVKLINEFK